MKTMICFILDRSGSMAGREGDVIGGVNTFVEDQKKIPGQASIACVRFDSKEIERFRKMMPLPYFEHLSLSEFQPRGGTPLLDAIGQTILELDDDWRREQPERAVVIIVTDGAENASRKFFKSEIKRMIQARQDSGKWSFVYLGADVDSFTEAGSIGIYGANTANFAKTEGGYKAAFAASGMHVNSTRTTGQTIASNLGGDLADDGSITNQGANIIAQRANPWTPPEAPATWTPPA